MSQNSFIEMNKLIKHAPQFIQALTDKKYPNHPLYYLKQPETRPQSQVWPEEIERIHETELVHWGLLHFDFMIEHQTKDLISIPLCGRSFLNSCYGSYARKETVRDLWPDE